MQRRIAIAIALLIPVTLALRAGVRTHAEESETYEDVYYLPPANWLRVFSLGHRAALADLLWIRALIYAGDEFGHSGEMRHVFQYTEGMLALEPDFEAVYHWIASAGMYHTAEIDRDDLLDTVSMLERGVARMPESGLLQWDLGATLAFESGPFAESDAERDDWRLRGIEHLMAATRLGAAPPWMMLSNASMLMRVGASERAVEHLEEMYATVDDPAVRQDIAERIARLRGDTYSEAFVSEAEAFEDARLHQFPYMHPHLYMLVGPRPPIDTDSSLRDGFAAHAFDDELDLSESFEHPSAP